MHVHCNAVAEDQESVADKELLSHLVVLSAVAAIAAVSFLIGLTSDECLT